MYNFDFKSWAAMQHLLRNKYFYTLVFFMVWMLFFDQNRVSNQYKLQKNLSNLEAQKQFYLSEIENQTNIIEALERDTVLLEKYAREKYLMKRDNEVVYVIVKE